MTNAETVCNEITLENQRRRPTRPVVNISQLTSAVRDQLHELSQQLLYEDKKFNALRQYQDEMTTADLNLFKEGLQELTFALQTVTEQFTNSISVVQLRRLASPPEPPGSSS